MMVIVEIKLKNDMEMVLSIIKIKVCIRMKLVVLQYQTQECKENSYLEQWESDSSSKRKQGTTSLFEFNYNPSSAYRIDEWNNDGQNVKNFAVSGSDNTWQIDEFDNDGIYKSTQRLNLNQIFEKEQELNKDLNSDGVLGNAISIAYQPHGGNKSLYKIASGDFYLYDQGWGVKVQVFIIKIFSPGQSQTY